MTSIAEIKPIERPTYKEVIWKGSEKTEADAPILQFYEITLRTDDGQFRRFDAEVRKAPRGEQIDWSDDLDDFLLAMSSADEANNLREEITQNIISCHTKYYKKDTCIQNQNTEQQNSSN